MALIASEAKTRVEPGDSAAKPIVSVIIIFLNAEQFLQEAIDSVFAQTYNGWELLLVDDGSSDAGTAIAQNYAKQYPRRVRYLEHSGHQNRGMPASRNLGIRTASGEFVAFLDADDVWLPHKLEQQVAILREHPAVGMVYSCSQYWYSWTGDPEDRQRDFMHEVGVPLHTPINPPSLFQPFFFRQEAAIPCPSNIMVRRKMLEEIKGFEESFKGLYNIYEDQAFFAKMSLRASLIATNAYWDRYRQHSNSSCSRAEEMEQQYEARYYFLNWLATYLSQQGIRDRKIWRELKKEQWRVRHPNVQRLARRMVQNMKQAKFLPFRLAQRMLPAPVYHRLRALWRRQAYIPPAGWVRWGNLRRLTPLSREYGHDRGVPVDRYYIEKFLSARRADIMGRVLEIADNTYTRRFGEERVTQSDVLHAASGSPMATMVGDLTSAEHIPSDSFDCVILTQTLQVIYDVPAALRTIHRILKPGGVALVTVPGISPVSRYDMERWGYYWSFTTQSAKRLFEEWFPSSCIEVESFGNVLAAAAFLFGMAKQELNPKELDYHDPDYELIITIRALKPEERL